jgi:hypothetical protein
VGSGDNTVSVGDSVGVNVGTGVSVGASIGVNVDTGVSVGVPVGSVAVTVSVGVSDGVAVPASWARTAGEPLIPKQRDKIIPASTVMNMALRALVLKYLVFILPIHIEQ